MAATFSRRGSILIVVMFVLCVLALVAVSFAYRVGLESRKMRDEVIQIQLRQQAASAAAIAMGRLKQNTNDYDHFAEPWHAHASLTPEGWLPEWSGQDDQIK
jgi:type II secretory pathway component PulK